MIRTSRVPPAPSGEVFDRPSRRGRGDGGVALVEFALVLPLLFLVLFGIIEFGSAYFQQLDVRHGAREGVRLLAVNAKPANSEVTQIANIAREACLRMDANPAGAPALITVDIDGTLVPDPGSVSPLYDIGDEVTITISKPLDQVTGFLDVFLNDITITSTVSTRLEQAAEYGEVTDFAC